MKITKKKLKLKLKSNADRNECRKKFATNK